jgi:3-oxoacyl-[acyl-carrier protein] reductase
MDLDLQDRVAVITGSSDGIGRAIAADLAREGAVVVLNGRDPGRLEEARTALAPLGSRFEVVPADVTSAGGAETLIETAAERLGRIDILVNNVGGGGGPAGFLALEDADWQRTFEHTLMSAVWCSRAAIPHMQRQRSGAIVNIASTSGREPDVVVPHYNAAKAGLINLSKTLANSFAGDGIRVNCVCPGLTHTAAVERAALARLAEAGESTRELDPAEAVAAYFGPRRPLPLGRVGQPADISALVVLLCSDRSSWTTGACISIDGGWSKSIF